MPREKVEREISNDGSWQVVERDVTQGDTVHKAQYRIPVKPDVFLSYLNSLSKEPGSVDFAPYFPTTDSKPDPTESALAFAMRMFNTAIVGKATADVRESVAQESTQITVPGVGKVDIMTLPLAKLVKGINGARQQRDLRLLASGVTDETATDEKTVDTIKAVDRGIGFGPWRTAAKRLVEDGKAKENSASGMLEVAS